MNFRFLGRQRSVGLDVGSASVRALVLTRRRSELVVSGCGVAGIEGTAEPRPVSQAIHAALAAAGADGEPVVASIGGPDLVIRQVSLPPLKPAKMLQALEVQHRELGLLPPDQAVLDAQILRRGKDGTSNEVLSVSVPKARIEERMKQLAQAAVTVRTLDVEPLALLNAGLSLMGSEAEELYVLLTVGRRHSVLCLFSERGPVVARYFYLGAEAFMERLRGVVTLSVPKGSSPPTLQGADIARAEAACRDIIERIAEDIRLSLTFYRTEYDRESLPRYAIGGSLDVPHISRWIATRLGLDAPFELMDPLEAVEVAATPMRADVSASGSQFLQAFGLALRGL
jgi:Tfp pilus assembly PilM family ATPase